MRNELLHALNPQRKYSEKQIREHLTALEKIEDFGSAFVREAMRNPMGGLQAHWRATLEALAMTKWRFGTKDKRFARLKTPWILSALQAGVVQGEAPGVVVAVLAHDGSEASHDALLAEFEGARAERFDNRLDHLLEARRYAKKNAHWEALEKSVRGELARRDAEKHKGSVAQRLGLNVELLKIWMFLTGKGPRYSGEIHVFLDYSDQFSISHTRSYGTTTQPPKDFTLVAKWLTEVTKADSIRWEWAAAEAGLRTNLRGKQRAALIAWLKGERATPSLK